MNRSDIQTTIKQLLVDNLRVAESLVETVNGDTPLLGRGIGLDSVEALQLALGLENAFRISIPDADLTVELFSSLDTLTDYISQKIAAGEPVR